MKAFSSQADYSVLFTKEDGTQYVARVLALFTNNNPKFDKNYYCALYSEEFNPETDEPIVLFRVENIDKETCQFVHVTDKEEALGMFQSWDAIIVKIQNNQLEGVDINDDSRAN